MATELATAYLALVPSLGGAKAAIESELSGINLQNQGRTMGSSMVSGMSGSMQKMPSIVSNVGKAFSSTFGRVAKVGSAAIGGIGASVVGLAAKGGLTRALNLEQAQTMFKGLKLNWADFEDTVRAAVDGTAFSMDAAALTAASLAAAGVSAGSDMEKALNGAVGVSATFGADLGDIGQIFSKVAAQGKLTGETIQQFADRGINVTSVLSTYLGKNGDEIREMVRRGQIDFKTFSDAMYAAFGDSAMAANATFTGSLANMRSALNKIGENFMTPFKDSAIPVFNAVREALNGVRSALAPVVGKFTEMSSVVSGKIVNALSTFTDYLNSGNSIAASLSKTINGIFGAGTVSNILGAVSAIGGFAALGPILKSAGAGMGVMSGAMSKISALGGRFSGVFSALSGKLSGSISSLVEKFTGIAVSSEKVAASLGKIGRVSKGLGGSLLTAVGGLGAVGAGLFVVGASAAAAGVDIAALSNNFLTSIQGIAANLPAMAQQFAAMIPALIQQLNMAMPALVSAFNLAITSLVQVLPIVLPQLVLGITSMITQLIPVLITLIPLLLQGALQLFTALVQSLSLIMPQLIAMLPVLVSTVCTVLIENLPLLLTAALELFMALVTGFIEMLPQLIEKLPELIMSVTETILGFLPQLLECAGELFMEIVHAIPGILGSLGQALWDLLTSIPPKILEFLPKVAEAGLEMISGIGKGIGDGVKWIMDKVGELCGKVLDGIKGFFGIHSPSAVMRDLFQNVGEGAALGLEDEAKPLAKAMNGMLEEAASVAEGFSPNISLGALEASSMNELPSVQSANRGTKIAASDDLYMKTAIKSLGSSLDSKENMPVISIHDCEFTVRNDADINDIAESLYLKIMRESRGRL